MKYVDYPHNASFPDLYAAYTAKKPVSELIELSIPIVCMIVRHTTTRDEFVMDDIISTTLIKLNGVFEYFYANPTKAPIANDIVFQVFISNVIRNHLIDYLWKESARCEVMMPIDEVKPMYIKSLPHPSYLLDFSMCREEASSIAEYVIDNNRYEELKEDHCRYMVDAYLNDKKLNLDTLKTVLKLSNPTFYIQYIAVLVRMYILELRKKYRLRDKSNSLALVLEGAGNNDESE